MREIPFVKMDGLGNDFVIIDNRDGKTVLKEREIVQIGNRKTGVGFDQLIVIEKSEIADAKILFFNADGSTAGACGNGTRCASKLMMDKANRDSWVFESPAGGLLKASREKGADIVSVNMGKPHLSWNEIPLAKETDTLYVENLHEELPAACAVSMGNPHAVFFVEDAEAVDIERLGALMERHEMFPDRVNVEFAQIVSPDLIRMRVFERGAGVTEACGSGACATLVAAVRRGLNKGGAEIKMDGGSLFISYEQGGDVLMTGATHKAFDGTLYL